MLNYKILLKVTGSIAAYKSAYLVSKLVQSGCDELIVQFRKTSRLQFSSNEIGIFLRTVSKN